MKKQILLTVFVLLAILAGVNKSYGQLSKGSPDLDHLDAVPTYCAPAIALTCGSPDALHPAPGVAYDYTITSSSAGKIHWFVTDDSDIMDAQGNISAGIEPSDGTGSYILTASSDYNNAAGTSLTVNITWKSFDATANKVILVAYNVDEANCTDNIEAYLIQPKYSFALDIAGIADDGTTGGDAVSDCVNPIQAANFDGTTLTVDYGTDYVFFAVNASNWLTSWKPENFAATTTGTSTVAVDGWAYPDEAATTGAWHAVGDDLDPVEASHYTNGESVSGFVDSDGACIIVRVSVDHSTVTENLAAEVINLTVNGEMLNPETSAYDGQYPDLENVDADNDGQCDSDLTTDNVDYTLTPRPDVDEAGPTPFVPKVPNAD